MSKTNRNALLWISGRIAMVESVLIGEITKVAATKKFNVTPATERKWVKWYASAGA